MVQILCYGARCESAAQEIRCSRRLVGSAACVNEMGFLEKESEDRVSLVLVIWERRRKMTWDMRPTGSPSVRWASLPVRQGHGRLPHGGESPARRKDIVLVGGVCGILDEQVRHRQGRKDTAAKTTRAKGQHTDPGVWRKDPVHAAEPAGKWEPRFHQECLLAC